MKPCASVPLWLFFIATESQRRRGTRLINFKIQKPKFKKNSNLKIQNLKFHSTLNPQNLETMKKHILSILILCLMSICSQGQIELSFTALDNTSYVQLDSIKVMNRTQGGDTLLIWPDTVLVLSMVGLNDNYMDASSFTISQNFPNPVINQSTIKISIPSSGDVALLISDIHGSCIIKQEMFLKSGTHIMKFVPGNQRIYIFSAYWGGKEQSIKILNGSSGLSPDCSLEYRDFREEVMELKTQKSFQSFPFSPGDELLYITYVDGEESGMTDAPLTSNYYSFQFATNIPCPGTPTVTYEGQVYNTIQIYNQCWFRENLNAGTMIPGTQEMQDNGTIEKYCYYDADTACDHYGGFYQWTEIMGYDNIPGIQGICPPGWHIPTNEEWKILEGATDSVYGIGDPEWDGVEYYRGFDTGKNLKSVSSWDQYPGIDLYEFSVLASGLRHEGGGFIAIGLYGIFWTSNKDQGLNAFVHSLYSGGYGIYLDGDNPFELGFSLRCIKD